MCTGGGSGIGRAAVEAFVAAGRTRRRARARPGQVRGAGRLGDAVVAVAGDATTRGRQRARSSTRALERWERIDVAVTFVGVFDLYTPLADIPDDRFDAAFDEMFALNVQQPAAHRPGRTAARCVDASGSIVFTLSSSSFYAGRGGALYVSSKFALRGVVVQLAHELAPDVRVNGVAPGGTVGTDLRGPRSLGLDDHRLDDRPGRAEQLQERTPLHVALTGADHAGSYVFLASGPVAGMTGEILRSDGGLGVR